MTSPATIALMSPADAYTLGMLDERLRHAEELREQMIERVIAAPKPKAPKGGKPTVLEAKPKETELPHVNGNAEGAIGESRDQDSPSL